MATTDGILEYACWIEEIAPAILGRADEVIE